MDLTKTIEQINALPDGEDLYRDARFGEYASTDITSDALKLLASEYERLRGESEPKTYAVIYGNYFPREVDSYWNTKEEAEAQANKLNDEDKLNSRMWEVEEI